MRKYKNGVVVKVNTSFLNQPAGVLAFVYEEYSNNGISLITEYGIDLGGFSKEEQDTYLEYLYHSTFSFEFKNQMDLAKLRQKIVINKNEIFHNKELI